MTSSMRLFRQGSFLVGLFALSAIGIAVTVANGSVLAAPEPDADGVFRSMELAPPNTFRVYARPGETIHFTVFAGERKGTTATSQEAGLCTYISLRESDGTILSGARIAGTQYNGASISQTGAARQRTCGTTGANTNRVMQEVTVSYTVPAIATTAASMADAYRAEFEDWTRDGSMVQGYEWRVRVNNSATDPTVDSGLTGRVWFVGDETGMSVWQNNVEGALTSGRSTHSFRYVRSDGYRYAVRYDDYQGIWSDFHGGVYGARLNSGDRVPIYRSFDQDQDGGPFIFNITGNANVSYVFVDCPWGDLTCPATLPATMRSRPITSNALGAVETAGGNTYTADDASNPSSAGNPLADANSSSTATNNYRYTGYAPASNLAGGRVTVPYTAMQSGTVRLRVSLQDGTLLCQRDFLVDDPDGSGIAGASTDGNNTYTWQFQQDPACSSGTLRTANVSTVAVGDGLTITAQAIRLGEMHFIEADTESRGGIEVRGNGLGTPAQLRSVAWYDPFSRRTAHTCGNIPPQLGNGSPVAGTSGVSWDSASGDNPFYYQDTNLDGTLDTSVVIPRLNANTTVPANGEREAVDSGVTGGVHGWSSEDGCYGSSGNGGYSNDDGTATNVSTWGNERVIDDWTYAFRNPPARVLSVGGATYTLSPIVDVAPGATISTGEQATFTMSVRNQSTLFLSHDTDWTIRRIVIPPGATLNTASRNPVLATDFSCTYYTSVGGGVTCSDVASDHRTFPAGTATQVGINTETGAAVGSRICYALMVNSASETPRPNFAEVVTCVTVAKLPHLEARNGDVYAGGVLPSVSPTCTLTASPILASSQVSMGGSIYSSYATYGVTSLGMAEKFGSASLSFDTISSPTKSLIFSNNEGGNSLGYFRNTTGDNTSTPTTGTCLNDPFVVFGPRATAANASTTVDISTLTTNTVLTAPGTITLSASQPITRKIVVYARNAHIKIVSNIAYADHPYASVNDIPQVVLLTNRSMVVAPGVAQLDGIYAAKDNFYSCDVVPRLHVCEARLTVNGAVIVGNHVVALRTNGADQAHPADMAEIFNLAPSMFLNQLPQNNGSDVYIKTLSETEVPPRF